VELTTNGMPAGFADGIDDAGITVETDPTVTNWVKDGVSWAELKSQGMPPGFTDDVDNVGITVETDPQVDDNMINNYVPRWNSTTTQLVTGNIYNDPAGNVGIGTTGPGSQLEIGINAAFTGRRLRLLGYATTAGTDANFEIGDGSSVYWRMARNNRNNFQTDMSGTWGIIGGNVGIGTPSPQSALHISKGAGTSLILESDPSGAASYLKFSADAGPQTKAQIAGNKYGADGGTLTFSTLQGGALTAGMKIDSAGNVGIGTPAPGGKLHIVGGHQTLISRGLGNTFMEHWLDGNSALLMWGDNDGVLADLRLGSATSENADGFQEFVRIKSSGNVGIGTPSPAYKLDVNGPVLIRGDLGVNRIQAPGGTDQPFLTLRAADNYTVLVPPPGGFRVTNYQNAPPNNLDLKDNGNLTIRGTITSGSDSRMKANQEPLDYGLAEVLRLQPMRFVRVDWTMEQETGEIIIDEATRGTDFGLIAQEVYEIMPEAVDKPEDESTDYWSLGYEKLVAVLVKAIQEQQAQIEELKNEIQAIKSGN